MFHVYEALMGSPPTERMLIWANQVGFALLIGLMGLAFYNDLSRIF
jgi:regulator of sigma E protease